ncbi:MAG: NADH-quinone oxidoreductase subunit C [Flammeovirgaceae bacterium]|jgi:NADH-quinone oxidoreductase subunit C|nr:NADH-quinone oxidoreductase subunit C [Flammeovirgaceae bacterium]
MSDKREELIALIRQASDEVTEIANSTPFGVIIKTESLLSVCELLYKNPTAYFDMLSCVTGIDNGIDTGTMEVIYHLYSIPLNQSIVLKVILPRENPEIESVSTIWKSANWLEREVFDMFGINFKNHPDLRRILMPADWKGYPLRKDYKHEEYYRNIKIEY